MLGLAGNLAPAGAGSAASASAVSPDAVHRSQQAKLGGALGTWTSRFESLAHIDLAPRRWLPPEPVVKRFA
jgi:hypothetical protein